MTLTEDFTAGQTKNYTKPGAFFKLFRTTAPVNVKLFKAGQIIAQEDGVEAGLALDEVFDSFSIESATAQSVSWFVARGQVTYDRTVGEVSIVDGGKARSLADVAFLGITESPALAANYSTCQLWNAAANTKRVILEALLISSPVAGQLLIYSDTVARAQGPYNGFSKRFGGGALSQAKLYYENNGGVPGTNCVSLLHLVANQTLVWSPREPVVLLPGQGIQVTHAVVNTKLDLTAEWWEEDN